MNNPSMQLYGAAAGITRDHSSIYDNSPTEEHMETWLAHTCELVDKYHPKLIFF